MTFSVRFFFRYNFRREISGVQKVIVLCCITIHKLGNVNSTVHFFGSFPQTGTGVECSGLGNDERCSIQFGKVILFRFFDQHWNNTDACTHFKSLFHTETATMPVFQQSETFWPERHRMLRSNEEIRVQWTNWGLSTRIQRAVIRC